MTLFIDRKTLDARRMIGRGALAPLMESLGGDQERVLAHPIIVPSEKALLSRVGGRCERDGTQLEFDPWSPHEHRCPMCGVMHRRALHDRWWLYPYQLWLAERVVHSATLFAIGGDERHSRFAHDVLQQYADAYLTYANRDNVLGPSRPFFSTYLESIWLLQLCVAVDLLEVAGDAVMGDEVRERIIAPSAALIASYNEGDSNRQVWNNAALLAAYLLLDHRGDAERVVHAPSGVAAHLAHGLLADGTWYEGENYHQFTHRGLWYGVTMAARAGIQLPPELIGRFDAGFAATFATVLPDLTLPSRKDSQYATSLRQWRFAESCELGLGRGHDTELAGMLTHLYDGEAPAGDTGRWRSSAEAERNVGAVRLTRADLGWKSLLFARAEVPASDERVWRSALLEGQGVAVFRRDQGAVYIALDYGQSGGGHGHPDRLNALFSVGATRWLDDLGTGSYVDRSLHWYRSTLAHNAPMVDGRSQLRTDGTLLAFDERGAAGWVRARARIHPQVDVERTLIVMPDYFVDEVRWWATTEVVLALPVHFDGAAPEAARSGGGEIHIGDGLEDGAELVDGIGAWRSAPREFVPVSAERAAHAAQAFVACDRVAQWYALEAPGQPADARRRFFVVEAHGSEGRIRSVWGWRSSITEVAWTDAGVAVTRVDGGRHVHAAVDEGWHIDLEAGGARSSIDLEGGREIATPARAPGTGGGSSRARGRPAVALQPMEGPLGWFADAAPWEQARYERFALGESHYRRSEESWREAGHPTARIAIGATSDQLIVDAHVIVAVPRFVAADAVNPYDNEAADINGESVQLYCDLGGEAGAWVLAPDERTGALGVRPISGWGGLRPVDAVWRRVPDGYEVRVELPLDAEARSGGEIALEVIVNESGPGRERRRGQLVLSGAHGGFVYLRGDRDDLAHALRFIIQP